MLGVRARSSDRRPGKSRLRAVYRSGAVAATAMALAGVLPASAAHADGTLVAQYTGIIRNWASGDCLDAFANVNPCYDNGTGAWQRWTILTSLDGSEYYIQNAHTGQCLDNGNPGRRGGPPSPRPAAWCPGCAGRTRRRDR
ncbi:RICIN domain-containing protein [Kitasatospora sp. NPDC052896]|uniref:RICIN domain-containing protein n=1 Tax=Kitasatospora sp. NPDC052896 TaxID=3364061 RepID=UPI0037C912BA